MDILWENIGVKGMVKWKSRLLTITIAIFLIFISFLMLFLISYWQASEKKKDIS